ncbi:MULTISPECIES: winged helix-turn-helix domain-containing protein [unclassified Pseudoalteromonas]|uniref:winged helix-turn-helix domain-containing protein n=1 Tax=unclassified Pseudoalteromonas TaxID=194690 RepID=UPI000CF6E067|nr:MULTISPECIES: winged helix-turn-helix domain-containing protein [unclassified Pseudoalteromonas]MBS3797115.1 winged helix-turn-helix domain-containing protein [Pseudoalteromonas sp. BDTF-M6]
MQTEFWLGEYLVSPKHNKLTLPKRTFTLEPKVMAILCLLVQHRGEVLSREEILTTLWPDQVTEPEVVTRAIFELRKVFCDDPKKPIYIETIAKKGYSFIHQVTQSKSSKRPRVNFKVLVTTILLFVLIIILAFALLLKPFVSRDMAQFRVIPLSSSQESVTFAAPDTNWKYSLLIRGSNKEKQIFLKDLESHKTAQLTARYSDYKSPAWGKQSNSWYYVDCANSSCQIIRHNTKTGKKVTVFTASTDIKAIALSEQEKVLALTISDGGKELLAVLNLDEKKPELAYISQPGTNTLPTFLKGSEALFYVNWHTPSASRIMRYDIQRHSSTEVSKKLDRITALTSHSNNNLIAAAKLKGEYALWQLNLSTDKLSRYANLEPTATIRDLHLNNDGNKLMYMKSKSDLDIQFVGFNKEFKGLNSDAHDMKAVWSASTESLYFVSNRTGSYELWLYRQGSNEKLTDLNADNIAQPVLSHAQDKLAFITRKENFSYLTIYDAQSATLHELGKVSPGSFLLGWSFNADALYLSVGSENIYDLTKYEFQSGEIKTIKLGAGLIAQESQQGETFYYGDLRNKQLKRIDANGDDSLYYDFSSLPLRVAPNSVKVADGKVYYLSESENHLHLFRDKDALLELPKKAFVSQIITEPTTKLIYDLKPPAAQVLEMQVSTAVVR